MDNFFCLYQNHRFQDDGAYCSNDFKSFARKFKNFLNRNLPSGVEIVNHRCGHYDLSGFAKKGDSYVYYSWSWDRFNPVDAVSASGAMRGCLYRTAKHDRDWTGGFNQFCPIAELPRRIAETLDRA